LAAVHRLLDLGAGDRAVAGPEAFLGRAEDGRCVQINARCGDHLDRQLALAGRVGEVGHAVTAQASREREHVLCPGVLLLGQLAGVDVRRGGQDPPAGLLRRAEPRRGDKCRRDCLLDPVLPRLVDDLGIGKLATPCVRMQSA